MNWALYILLANIYLVIFYGFYKLLLDRETFFKLNRTYLLAAGLFSLMLPFLRINWFASRPEVAQIYLGADQLNGFMTQVTVAPETTNALNTGNIIVLIYLAGVLFFSGRLLYKLVGVNRLFKKNSTGMAFSFLNRKKIDPALQQVEIISKHEEIHIRQYHTLDIIFFELLNIVNWFNPVIYFYKRTIKHVHEFLADEEAANFQGNKDEYSLLLLSSTFGVPINKLTNTFFNSSLIKKRIFMLHKERSKKAAILKYGLFLPLFAIMLLMSSATIRNNPQIRAVANELPLDNPVSTVIEVISAPDQNKTRQNDAMETRLKNIPGDWTGFYTFLQRTIRYPAQAISKEVQGSTLIRFTLKSGQVENLSVASKLGNGCDAQVMKSILTYDGFTSNQDGQYTLQATFSISGSSKPFKKAAMTSVKGFHSLKPIFITGFAPPLASKEPIPVNENDTKVYDFVSVQAQPNFSGGMEAFYQYLKSSIKYPKEAKENRIQGKVFLSFIVEKDGTLADIKVERKLGYGTDEESIRVLKASPKWIPGILDGKAVRVKYNIPISFNLAVAATNEIDNGPKLDKKSQEIMKIETGKDAPQYIIDGKTIEDGTITQLQLSDIQTINIQKGSLAAPYGAPERNGVIVITTKKAANKD